MATALVTLLNTIEFHFLKPLPCLVFDDREIMIESLCKKLRFLQAFLEDCEKNNIKHQARRALEMEMRDVGRDAEGKIESELHQLYLSYNAEESPEPVEACQSLYQTLQQVTRDIESIERRIQIESNNNPFVEPKREIAIENIKARSFSQHSSLLNNVMVGCEDEFDTIKHKLISHSQNLEVISILGMGGIGKTTLVKRVYEDETIASHFDIRAWATASQQHNPREMLFGLLGSTSTNGGDVSCLASQLRRKLLGQRYLIVIDDIWSSEAWDDIHRCFAEEDLNGSRILLTTRLKQVADYVSSGNNPHYKQFLNPNESWSLFYKKVFEENKFPLEFEIVGRDIVGKCQGLPLTIVVVAGLLTSSRNSSLNQWENIVENLNSFLNTDPEEKCSKILSLSYNNLPLHLKVCFLYFGVFLEDSEIFVEELIRLWVAEGFLKLELNKTMEEVAYACLQDLVDRGLVQIHKWSSDGKIKYCRLHDVLHSFSLREAQRENLLFVINENNVHELAVGLATGLDRKACRWISNQLSYLDDPVARERYMTHTSQELRSFLYFPKDCRFFYPYKSLTFPYAKLLRVLKISDCILEDIPSEIEDLVHLRYLNLTTVNVIPPDFKWFKLRSLQTFITVIHSDITEQIVSPINIFDVLQIRHICFHRGCYYLNLPKWVQGNLQTVYWLSLPLRSKTKPDFKRIPNVKELGIYLMTRNPYERPCKGTWDLLPPFSIDALVDLHKLENLKIDTDQCYRIGLQGNALRGDIQLPNAFPPNLKKLTLTRTYLLWEEDMATIGTLPNLEFLKLEYKAFIGPEWKATGNGFCKLKYLEVESPDLEHWSVDADHFPVLECLFLKEFCCLEEIPTGFAEINTLQLIDLTFCHSSLVTSAKKIQEERIDLGDDKLVVHVFRSAGWRKL